MPLVPSRSPARGVAASLALALVACLARADIPPPPRNEGCSVEALERTGLECLTPWRPASPELWRERGFEPRCDLYRPYPGGGGTPPGSVWCRAPVVTSRPGSAERDARPAAQPGGADPVAGDEPPPPSGALAAAAAGTGELASLLAEGAPRDERSPGNVVVSPLAVWTALATASAGARGLTASELRRGLLLEASPVEAVRAARALARDLRRRGVAVSASAAVLVDRSLQVSPEFAAAVRAAGAELDAADFQRRPGDAALRLDRWVARETGGRLTQLVPRRALYRNTRLALAATGGVAARWSEAFAPGEPIPFFLGLRRTGPRVRWGRVALEREPVASKEVGTWRAAGAFAVASLDGVFGLGEGYGAVVVDVPLRDGLAITMVLPHAILPEVRRPAIPLARLLAQLRPQQVALTVPAFAVDAPASSVGDALAELGARQPFRTAFDAREGDLSAVVANPTARLVLGELFHRAFLDLAPPPPAGPPPASPGARVRGPGVEIRIDHPFLFFVRDVASGVVVVSGAVNDPAPEVPEGVADLLMDGVRPVARALRGATVTAGPTTAAAPLRRDEVRQALEARIGEVADCYGQQLLLEPNLEGTLTLRWKIDGQGLPEDVRGKGPAGLAGERVRDCVVRRMGSWILPARVPGAVEQSWTLEPPRGGARRDGPGWGGRRYKGQPGERCRPAGAADALGAGAGATRPAAPVGARAADLEVSGPGDEKAIRKVLLEHAGEIRGAYQQRLAQDRRLQGTVAIEWLIDAEGKPRDPRVDCSATTLDDTFVFEAIKARILTWRFPRPRPGTPVVVNHRWTFVPLTLSGPR